MRRRSEAPAGGAVPQVRAAARRDGSSDPPQAQPFAVLLQNQGWSSAGLLCCKAGCRLIAPGRKKPKATQKSRGMCLMKEYSSLFTVARTGEGTALRAFFLKSSLVIAYASLPKAFPQAFIISHRQHCIDRKLYRGNKRGACLHCQKH
ncbi:uncharacterized protein LOC101749419 [Gallus gallus]|uniref:uncharacterized protein LOC101749419 n=1 Tax=Gallus gallus TaxID=9031 RepID=UPI001F01A7E7|nr:uncharacterized protein LOC101749419 [Gallus gallus]